MSAADALFNHCSTGRSRAWRLATTLIDHAFHEEIRP